MTDTTDWSGFDAEARRAAQANCHHLIHCAVDAATRAAVSRHLDNARSTGDATAILVRIAQLTGPCRLPPDARPDAALPSSSPDVTGDSPSGGDDATAV